MTAAWLAAQLFVGDPVTVVSAPPTAVDAAPALAAWHGDWTGSGTAFGQPATATLSLTSEGGATRLTWRLTVAGAPPYSAGALYRVDDKGRFTATWVDGTGGSRPVRGRVGPAGWFTHWGSADSEIGRSTYALESDGSLLVSDSVLGDDGRWGVFAALRYRRQ